MTPSQTIIAFRPCRFAAFGVLLVNLYCAPRAPLVQQAATEALVPLGSGAPPLLIDLGRERPFSRLGIPWDDSDVVGLDIVWLLLPGNANDRPIYLLVINEYTKSQGLMCLVSESGSIHASSKLGIIQKVMLSRIAPISDVQFLVYANPDHGPGACIGSIVLLSFSDGEFRELLDIQRYAQTSLGGQDVEVALPLLIRGERTTRIALPLFNVRATEDDVSWYMASPTWKYVEYEWDVKRRRFAPTSMPIVIDLVERDAWEWLPNYDSRSTSAPVAMAGQ